MDKTSKKKLKKWFNEARGVYNFIHWQEKFKLKADLKLVKNNNDTTRLHVVKVA